jgi:hypothetical protein
MMMTLRTVDLLLAGERGVQQPVELVDPGRLGLEPGLQPLDRG